MPADLAGSVSLSPESQVFVDPQHYSIHVLRIRTFRAYEFHVSSVFVAGRITARAVHRLRIAPHAARISVTHSRLFAQALKSIHLPHFLRRTLMSTHFAFATALPVVYVLVVFVRTALRTMLLIKRFMPLLRVFVANLLLCRARTGGWYEH